MDSFRILLAEDEFLVGALLEENLQLSGFETVGPFTSLGSLREAIPREKYHAAVLDVNLGGTMVFPAAADLKARGIPFIILTGYGAASLPEEMRHVKIIPKPYDFNLLERELRQILELGHE